MHNAQALTRRRLMAAAFCQGDAACLENLVCCALFADCNAVAAVPCVFANAN